jgi:hypothetical protein
MAQSKRNEITAEKVKNLFYYKDGSLYWLKNDKKISSKGCGRYVSVMVNYKNYMAHRIIYLLHHGYMPNLVDHIDGNKENNCIENLRKATYSENCYNATKRKSITGVKNVTYCKSRKKFKVQIHNNGKNKSLGYFDDLNDAVIIAEKSRINICKQFARNE